MAQRCCDEKGRAYNCCAAWSRSAATTASSSAVADTLQGMPSKQASKAVYQPVHKQKR